MKIKKKKLSAFCIFACPAVRYYFKGAVSMFIFWVGFCSARI